MEIRDLLSERRRMGPGSLTKAGHPYLVEEGRLLHDTRKFRPDTTTRVVGAAREDDDIALDMTRRRVFRLASRSVAHAGEVVVGRGPQADVRLELSSVSRRHALLRRGSSGWTVQDEGSTNGTFVDGERLTPLSGRPLSSSSVLRFGPEARLTFLEPDALERFVGQLEAALALGPPASAPGFAGHAVDVSRSKVLGKGELPAFLEDEDTAHEDPSLPPSVPMITLTSTRRRSRPHAEGEAPTAPAPLALECRPFPPLALIEGRPIVVGRVAGNDLVLPHALVSRRHAQFERVGDEVVVIDLGSANGVLVSGKRVERGPVPRGEPVAIGPYELRVVAAEAPAPPGPVGGATIAILGQVSLRGVLEDVPLEEVLSGIEFNRKSGVLEVTGSDGTDGSIVFRNGAPLKARCCALEGEAAIKRLLSVREGRFSVRADEVLTSGQGDIAATFTKILLDHGREHDEQERA